MKLNSVKKFTYHKPRKEASSILSNHISVKVGFKAFEISQDIAFLVMKEIMWQTIRQEIHMRTP